MSEFLPLLLQYQNKENYSVEYDHPCWKSNLSQLVKILPFKEHIFLSNLGLNTMLPAFLKVMWFCTIIFNSFLVVHDLTKWKSIDI